MKINHDITKLMPPDHENEQWNNAIIFTWSFKLTIYNFQNFQMVMKITINMTKSFSPVLRMNNNIVQS